MYFQKCLQDLSTDLKPQARRVPRRILNGRKRLVIIHEAPRVATVAILTTFSAAARLAAYS